MNTNLSSNWQVYLVCDHRWHSCANTFVPVIPIWQDSCQTHKIFFKDFPSSHSFLLKPSLSLPLIFENCDTDYLYFPVLCRLSVFYVLSCYLKRKFVVVQYFYLLEPWNYKLINKRYSACSNHFIFLKLLCNSLKGERKYKDWF